MAETPEVEVTLGQPKTRALVTKSTDPFAVSGEEVLKMAGLNPTIRRRISRTMEKKYESADGSAASKQLNPYAMTTTDGYGLFGCVLPPYNMDYLAKIYEMSPPHYAAVKAKVMNIVGLGYRFETSAAAKDKLANTKSERTKKAVQQNIDREKTALLDWLDSCNQEDEFAETLIKVWTDYETTGNGYIEIGRGLDGSVKYIGHIPSVLMRIRRDRDGFVQVYSNQAVFFRNFGDRESVDPIGSDAMPNEVIHLKKYSPTHTYYGVPDIVAAQQAIAGNEFSARFNLDYFENKAVPRYVIVLKGANFSEQAQANLLEFFETGLKGQNHRTLFVPLPAGDSEQEVDFKMEPVEAGMQDSSFLNYRRGNLDEILMAHRVPITKVGTSEGVNLANAVDMDKTFKEQVCRPEQDILEKKLNKVIKEMTDVVVLQLNELSLSDENTQSQIDQRYLQMQTIVPNEVRGRLGLPPIDGGDKVVDLKPQQAADKTNNAAASDSRAQSRSTGADKNGTGRNPKGEGRQTQ